MAFRSDAYFFASAHNFSSYRRLDEGHPSGYLARLLIDWIKSSGAEGYVVGAGKVPQTYVVKMINWKSNKSRVWLNEFMDYLDALDLMDWYQFVEIYPYPIDADRNVATERGMLYSQSGLYEFLPEIRSAYEKSVDELTGKYYQHKI